MIETFKWDKCTQTKTTKKLGILLALANISQKKRWLKVICSLENYGLNAICKATSVFPFSFVFLLCLFVDISD